MVSNPSISFEAVPEGDFERVLLTRSTPAKLPFGKPARERIMFDDWTMVAPAAARPAIARIMQAWADSEEAADGAPLAEPTDEGVRLHASLVASLSDAEATALGMPPATRLSLNLQSIGVAHQPDFHVETRWTRPNGLPAPVEVDGARLRYEGKSWRVTEPIWSTLRHIEQLNRAGNADARQAALAALRAAIGDEDRTLVKPDGFIERLRLSYAAGFSLDLKASAAGFDFDPVLFSPERVSEADEGATVDEVADSLLPPTQQSIFAGRFRRGDGRRRAYLLDDGVILFLDAHLRKALAVVHDAQSAGPEARRAFARNPQRRIAEALFSDGAGPSQIAPLFVETQQFSERVLGIDVWRKPVLPWIKPKPNSWLPESFGLRIGDPPDAETIEIPAERIPEAVEAVEAAVREERATFRFDNVEVPATEQTRTAIGDLAELIRAAEGSGEGTDAPPPAAAQRYFLQVRDNLEDVAYAPIASAAPIEVEAPAQLPPLRSTPKPHQIDGFNWLVACWRSGMPGAMLADDMGLGKTFQALAFLAWLRSIEQQPRPILIVAPTGLLANWRAEIARHLEPDALGRLVNAYGQDLRRNRSRDGRDIEVGAAGLDVEAWAGAGIILTAFETMRDYHLSFARQPFAAIIYDEVQKLKNPASQMTRAAKTLNARFQLAMTGTPVENRLQDLWSVFDVVHPGLLGSSKAFESAYPATDPDKLRGLHDLLTLSKDRRPQLLLRRVKDDCLAGLPEKHVRALPTQMPPRQATEYNQVIGRALAARGTGKRGHMLEILHQLRGVSLHPVAPEAAGPDYLSESARVHATFQTLDRISAAGEKALLFCESLAMQAMLAVEIKRRYQLDHDVARIHGGVQGDARQAAVDVFQRRGSGFDVMILSPKAGGVGLTLTAANHVIHLSRWWNPAVEDQATDRAFRIGQTRDVYVYLPQSIHPDPAVGPTSFDLKLDELMKRKRSLSRGLLLPGEDAHDADALLDAVLGEPSAADLKRTTTSADNVETGHPGAAAPESAPSRTILSPRERTEAIPPKPAWPARAAYMPRIARDHTIFRQPVAGEQISELLIRDPYGCADGRNRQALADFVAMLAAAARSIGQVRVVSFDADSVDRFGSESDRQQRDDLQLRLKRTFPNAPDLSLIQLSKRQSRTFHDRSVKASTASGRQIIWDVSNGLDGVMLPNKECVVHVRVE